MHEDEAIVEAAKNNDYIRFISANMGRFNSAAWRDDGIEPPLGEAWHYATEMLPLTYTEPETASVLATATTEVVSKSWHHGTPRQMADALAPYIEAGVNWVQIVDFLPLTRSPEEAPDGMRRAFELAGMIKNL